MFEFKIDWIHKTLTTVAGTVRARGFDKAAATIENAAQHLGDAPQRDRLHHLPEAVRTSPAFAALSPHRKASLIAVALLCNAAADGGREGTAGEQAAIVACRAVGISLSTFQRHLAGHEAAGLIERQPHRSRLVGGKKLGTHYRIPPRPPSAGIDGCGGAVPGRIDAGGDDAGVIAEVGGAGSRRSA